MFPCAVLPCPTDFEIHRCPSADMGFRGGFPRGFPWHTLRKPRLCIPRPEKHRVSAAESNADALEKTMAESTAASSSKVRRVVVHDLRANYRTRWRVRSPSGRPRCTADPGSARHAGIACKGNIRLGNWFLCTGAVRICVLGTWRLADTASSQWERNAADCSAHMVRKCIHLSRQVIRLP